MGIHAYIYFPDNLDDDIVSEEEGIKIIKDFQMSINLADCEKDVKLYYSKSNRDRFFENIHAFEELSGFAIGAYSFETVVDILFAEGEVLAVNESTLENYQIQSYVTGNSEITRDVPLIFYDIVKKHSIENFNGKLLILNLFGAYFSQNPILIIKDLIGHQKVEAIYVPFIINFVELLEWLVANRKQRNYNFTDFRHVENHPQSLVVSHGKSPLIGGMGGRDNAAKLLVRAIGDKRATKDLINLDKVNAAYIWYEFENDTPNNQYHGYHLVKAISHITDEKAVSSIPERIKYILDYIG